MGATGWVSVFVAVNLLLWVVGLAAVPISLGGRAPSLAAASSTRDKAAQVAAVGSGGAAADAAGGGSGVKDATGGLPTLASPTARISQPRPSQPQHLAPASSSSSSSPSTFDQLFDLFHRSPNATKPTSAALRSLEKHRGQSFAAALLDSRAPGATSYIIDVKREALAYRVDTARRNCQFARSVVQQWLREAYRSLLASNRTAALSCLQARVWEYQPVPSAPAADEREGASVTVNGSSSRSSASSASSATPRSRRYFTSMVMSDKAADGGTTLVDSNKHFATAERKLQEASDLASDLWTVLHNEPIPKLPASNHGFDSAPPGGANNNKTNGTEEYIRFRNDIEARMNAAAQEYESILQDMDHCTQVCSVVLRVGFVLVGGGTASCRCLCELVCQCGVCCSCHFSDPLICFALLGVNDGLINPVVQSTLN